MKLRLLILFAAAALAAAPAAGQTVKSLGYNTTNGNIVAATNVTFTNSVGFSTNARAATRTNLGGTTVGNAVFTATNAAAAARAIGLGTANTASFDALVIGATSGDPLNVDYYQMESPTLNFLFNWEERQLTQGANNIFTWSSTNAAFPVPVSFATNVTASGTFTATGNATLNGSGNLAPSQTADSASSLMTRDLVGQEFANPRTKIQKMYWFGMEGLGEWSTIGTAATSAYIASGGGGFSGGRVIYSTGRIGTNHAGAGLRLGADNTTGGSPFRFSDGGALTMRAQVRKTSVVPRPAIAFFMGSRTATQMWQDNAYGLYFVPQPTNVWTSNGVVIQHSRIAVSNVVWSVNTAGTNDTTEPVWTDLIGSLVTNGSAVYRNLGPHTSNNWVLAIGSTNASQVLMTNTGKIGPPTDNRQEVVLKLRIDGTTNTPYTIYGSVETGTSSANSAGESAEVSLTTTNNDVRQPQFWSRYDEEGGLSVQPDPVIRYFAIDGQMPTIF
jgi:hypothetical protein